MATTQNEHTGNGTQRRFSFTFPYIKEDDVRVSLRTTNDNVSLLDRNQYTFPSATEIQLNAINAQTDWQETSGAPRAANGNVPAVTVRVHRETDIDNPKAVFYPGSSVRAQDLNDNTLQNLYAEQERQNRAVDRIAGSTMQSNLTMQQSDIVFDGDNIGGSATTLSVVDPTANQTYRLPNLSAGTYNLVSTGDTNTVTSTMVDGSLVDANIAAGAEIAVNKLADGDARQLLQTSANGNDVEWTSNVDVPGTLDVTGAATFDGSVTATTFTGNLAGNVTGAVTGNADTATDLAAATKIESTEHAGHTPDNATYYTTAAAEARFWRQDTGGNETITGTGWTASDDRVATTRAIDNRIITLVDGVGGFVPIANETSFPTENPDINDPKGAGTIVSIGALANNLVFDANGSVTIANGAGQGNTVTITGGPQSTTIQSNSGALVETTATTHTYTWHRTTPDGANVNTVANAIANVNNVGNNIADVTTVAGQISPTNNIDTVAGVATEIGRLGTAAAVEDLGILGTTDVVADMNTLATADNVTAMDNCSDDIANINTVAGSIANVNTVATDLDLNTSNIETVAGSITNVNNVGGSIANVNTVAGNLTAVNDFGARYRLPQTTANEYQTDNDVGDLYFNISNSQLRVWNGSSWQPGVTAATGFASKSGDTFTGVILLDDSTSTSSPVLAFDQDADTGIGHSAANTVDIVAQGASRLEVTGTTAKAVVPTEIEVTTATTNAVTTALTVESQSSGTPAAGIGVGMDFAVETAANNVEIGAQVEAVTTDVTSTAEDVDLVVNLMEGGAAAAEKFRVTSAGNVSVIGGTVTTTGNVNLSLDPAGNGIIQAGANLDLNNNRLISNGDQSIIIQPAGTGDLVINEDGNINSDFRVESDSNDHMLFVDSNENRVGIGTSSPAQALDVSGQIHASNDIVAEGNNVNINAKGSNGNPGHIQIQEGTHVVTQTIPDTMATSYTIVYPDGPGTVEQVLRINSVNSNTLSMEWGSVDRAGMLENKLETEANVTIGGTTVASRRNAALVGPYTVAQNHTLTVEDGSKLVII